MIAQGQLPLVEIILLKANIADCLSDREAPQLTLRQKSVACVLHDAWALLHRTKTHTFRQNC